MLGGDTGGPVRAAERTIMRRSSLLVFTACYNERENIAPLIDQIVAQLPSADILVVDDNSPDGTWEVIAERATVYPQLTGVQRPRKLGIGSAHKYALLYAMREGYDTLITMDADFSHDPKYIPALLAAHAENTFVTGSRYCEGGSSDYAGYRNIISRVGNIAARTALGVKLNELTTYYRVFDVRTLRRLPLRRVNAGGYSYGVQIIYYLRKAGVSLREVPIHFADRRHSVSKIPRMQIVYSAIDLVRLMATRMNFLRNLEPDVFVDDACLNCGDRALAMKDQDRRAGKTRYVCLRCHTVQVPAKTAYKAAAESSEAAPYCESRGSEQSRS